MYLKRTGTGRWATPLSRIRLALYKLKQFRRDPETVSPQSAAGNGRTVMTPDPNPQTEPEESATRAIRFENVCAAHGDYCLKERLGPDGSVPGAARGVARYALVCENERQYAANFCDSPEAILALAVHEVTAGSTPVCYYDLDKLAGDSPPIWEGDIVEYGGERLHVHHVDEDLVEGEIARHLCLAREPDVDWDEWVHRIDEAEFDGIVVESGAPDERLPVRYDVAGTVVHVVFNTLPTAT
jgi:hypothetical protein